MNRHIIIIHEIYGVTRVLVNLKKSLEENGFTVSLPSLYEDNYLGRDEKLSYKRFYNTAGIKKSYRIIQNLIEEHKNSEIILLGFSVGATIAWLHSENPKLSKIIGVYGSKIREYLNMEPSVHTELLFCNEDGFDVGRVMKVLNRKKNVVTRLIPGEHGFYNRNNKSLIINTNKIIYSMIRE